MATTVSQTLQKLHFTILGLPMDVQMQDQFAKRVEAEGWTWLNNIINDYLVGLAKTSSHASVVGMLAKNGWGLNLSASDQAFWGEILKGGGITYTWLINLAMDTVGGAGKDTMTQREQVAQRYSAAAETAKKSALDEGAVAKAALNAMLMGVNETSKSVTQANSALDQFLASLESTGVSLTIIDGYISGASVLVDANGNGVQDPGEYAGKTDASGKVVLPSSAPAGKVIATGGTDLLTGKAFTGVLSAPQGATLVTPISTLVESLVSQGLATDLFAATSQVQTALGIPATVNALTFDPLASLSSTTDSTANKQAALSLLSVQQQVATVIAQASTSISKGTTAAENNNASQAVVSALASAISNSVKSSTTTAPTTPTTPTSPSTPTTPTTPTTPVATFDLKNTASIQSAVTTAAAINKTTLTTDSLNSIAKVVSQSNTLLSNASQGATIAASLTAMSKTAAVTQGNVVEQLKAAVAPANTGGSTAPSSISSALSSVNSSFASGEVSKQVTAASAGSISNGVKTDTVPGGSTTNSNAVVPTPPVTPPVTPPPVEIDYGPPPPDTTPPTIAITSAQSALKAGSTASLTFNLSETSTDFVASDVTVSGGTLSGFSGSGSSYTATFTPTANSTANGVVSVASGTFKDAAGNNNNDGADANNTKTFTVDTALPTIAITSAQSALKAGETASLTFTLSESATDFTAADITASGGTLSNFAGSGTSYTATFTPTANSTTNGVVSVASSKFTDAAGNENDDGSEANNTKTFSVDTVLPTIAISVDKTLLKVNSTAAVTLTLSETSSDFVASDIVVTGGTLGSFAVSNSNNKVYNATFTPTLASGTLSVASSAFSDAAGNNNADGADANNALAFTYDSVVPQLVSANFIVNKIDLTFDSDLAAATLPAKTEFLVKFGTNTVTLTDATLSTSGTTVTLSFENPDNTYTGTATVDVPAIKDAAGNESTARTGFSTTSGNAPTGSVVINGLAQQAQDLTVTDTIADLDGIPGNITYLWHTVLNGVNTSIENNNSTLTLTQADVGKVFKVRATYTDGLGNATTVWSASTNAIDNLDDAPSGDVTVTGTMAEDATLIASASAIRDADYSNTIPTGFSYQWLSNLVPIAGATNTTLVLGQAQVGSVVNVRVSYTDSYGTTNSVTSTNTTAVANVEDNYTGDIAITGATANNVKVGDVLQVTSTLADEDGIPTTGDNALTYQWYADGVAITSGGTGSAYTITRDSLGKEMSVIAKYTDNSSKAYSISKTLSGKVQNINNVGTGGVVLSATQPKEGETVTATTTTMQDADVLGAISFQWKADGVNVSNQTSSDLVLTESMVGKTITVVASYTDLQGFAESKTSVNFGPIQNVNQAPQGNVTIANNITGASLSVASEDQVIKIVQNLSDTDGLGTLSYEWLANDIVITGQTGSTLTLGQAQVGKTITARVNYTDGHDTRESVTSTNNSTVTNVNDSPTGTFAIVGTPTVGQKLTLNNTLADEDGIPTSGNNAFKYQWLADGVNINGATSTEFTLTTAVAGKLISCLVSYVDNQGQAESKVTSSTVAVGMTAVRSSTSPDVIGSLGQDTLTGSAGGDIFSVVANHSSVNVDTILNFTSSEDYLLVDLPSFGYTLSTYNLTSGTTVPNGKFLTAAPTVAGATFYYSSGTLYFDADGSGSTAAKPLVTLTGAPTLSADKIYL
jgi:hypothetical protein